MKSIWQKFIHLSTLWKIGIIVLLIALVAGGVMVYVNQEPPRDIRSFEEAEPKIFSSQNEIEYIRLKWGVVEIRLTDKNQINDVLASLKKLQVTEFINEKDYRNEICIYPSAVEISFHLTDDVHTGSMDFTVDYQNMYLWPCSGEVGQHWLVTNPEVIGAVFQKYCSEERDALASNTHYADLDNDTIDEIIVVNPQKNERNEWFEFAVYRQDGIMLYYGQISKGYDPLGDFYLYEKDGKQYLLEVSADRLFNRYLDWTMMQFDEAGAIVSERSGRAGFNNEHGPDYEHCGYDFDAETIRAFLHELDNFLQDSMLILSTDQEQMLYSTADNSIKRTVNDYMDGWYDMIPVLAQITRDEWMAMDLDARLDVCDELLRIDSQMIYAEGWAQTYCVDNGEERQRLMTEALWKSVTKVNRTEARELWMPVYTKNENNSFSYVLRDHSLTVNDYVIEQARDDSGAVIENRYRIIYDITDENGAVYPYAEEIEFVYSEKWPEWQVTKCESE